MENQKTAFNGTKQAMVMIAPYLAPEILASTSPEKLLKALMVPELQREAASIQDSLFEALSDESTESEALIFDCAKKIMQAVAPYAELNIAKAKDKNEMKNILDPVRLWDKFFALEAVVRVTLELKSL